MILDLTDLLHSSRNRLVRQAAEHLQRLAVMCRTKLRAGKLVVSGCIVIVLNCTVFNTTSNADPEYMAGRNSVPKYFAVLEAQIKKRWSEAAFRESVPAELCHSGRAVVSFRLKRSGQVDHVKLKHIALESVLPIHRPGAAEACTKLDQSLLNIMVEPLPPPPEKFCCPRKMIILFDPQRFHPLKVMLDMETAEVPGVADYVF